MSLRRLLSRVLCLLLPLAVASSVYLYLYPAFHGCAFPLPKGDRRGLISNSFSNVLRQHFAPLSAEDPATFRLLVLADPQLEGDSSLPKSEDELVARIQHHWVTVKSSVNETQPVNPRQILTAVSTALRFLADEDIPRALRAVRKRLDLLGNDYYLAHIYRTLHWWSRPTHVAVLGDLIGSQWVTDEEFERRGRRYWKRVFKGGERISDDITATGARNYSGSEETSSGLERLNATHSTWDRKIINIVGNHDVGYSGDSSEARIERFERVFGRANWDVRFQYPLDQVDLDNSTVTPPTLHLIILNTLTLDSPALSSDVQSHSYAYINDLISHRSYPVEDQTTFTLLLTHLPLHKQEGICTDGPYFTFHESDDEDGPDGVPRFKAGGLKEQNHLSDHVSTSGVLQGIFGMTGDETAPGGGWGRNGLILTGHDHTGCDVVHFVNRTVDPTTDEDSKSQPWKWDAKRYAPGAVDTFTPSIREVTLRSMMGEYGGNAGLLSLWFNTAVNEWQYEITMCMAGVQHIWWAVHIVDVVACILLLGYIATGIQSKLVKITRTKKIQVGQEKKRN